MDTLEHLERVRVRRARQYNEWSQAFEQHKRNNNTAMAAEAEKIRDEAEAQLALLDQKLKKLRSLSPQNENKTPSCS